MARKSQYTTVKDKPIYTLGGGWSSKTKQVPGLLTTSYKKGGRVNKTGLARVHKGEYIISKLKADQVNKLLTKVLRGR
jgi:hypothetical protein